MALATFYRVSLDWLASGAGLPEAATATAATEEEALLLFGFRQLPEEEAKHLLSLILSRVKTKAS